MARQSSAAHKQESSTKTRFEFFGETWNPAKRNEAEIFARMSADGWELVTVTESANHERRYYFKRPI